MPNWFYYWLAGFIGLFMLVVIVGCWWNIVH